MRKPGPVFFIITLVLLLPFLGAVYAEPLQEAFLRLKPARPGPDREIVILLEDFRFSPSVIRVKAGERVRLRLRNVGRHTHEFMAGAAVHLEEDVTEPPSPDFFEGISDLKVEVIEGMAMPMFEIGDHGEGEGEMKMGDDHGKEDMAGMEGQGQGDMGMGEMGMDETMRVVLGPGFHAEGMAMETGDDPHGNMIMMDPVSEVVIEFTVPEDKVGTWIFGCFQEDGLHFDAGMRGWLIVEP